MCNHSGMESPPPSPGPRYVALIELLRTAEALWNASRVFFERWGLSPSQFNVLNLLHDRPRGCSQIELSRQLIMHRSNVTGLIDRLAIRGLVQREENERDRRSVNVVLTQKGKELLAQILPEYHRSAELVWGDLSLERARQLVSELAMVSANAQRIAALEPSNTEAPTL
jgi:DNA-binding MarR family transcriptional regulator